MTRDRISKSPVMSKGVKCGALPGDTRQVDGGDVPAAAAAVDDDDDDDAILTWTL